MRPHPVIDLLGLPREEWQNATHIQRNLEKLLDLASEMDATVQLLFFAVERTPPFPASRDSVYGRWQLIAGKHGTVVLAGFWQVVHDINVLVGRCPTLRSRMDSSAKDHANSTFERTFPGITKLRHVTAHPEALSRPEKLMGKDGHAITGEDKNHPVGRMLGEGSSYIVKDMLEKIDGGARFTSMVEKKLISYDLSQATIDALHRIFELYCAAFYPAEPSNVFAFRNAGSKQTSG